MTDSSITVSVNGQQRTVPAGTSLADIVSDLGAGRRGCAIAVNEEVVPRPEWARRDVGQGDRVEVLTAVQGG